MTRRSTPFWTQALWFPLLFLWLHGHAYADLDPPSSAFDGSGPIASMKTISQLEPRTPIKSIPFTITEPGSYYLVSDLIHTTVNADGITIDTDNVTLDLNGYTLSGGSAEISDDGIYVLGSQLNIHIKNGTVRDWDGDGINALNADSSIFENLSVSGNGGDGLVADYSAIIVNCTANNNGLDGLEGDDGTIIKNSTAFENGDNGFQTSEGSMVLDSASYKNMQDGFDLASGSLVSRSVARENGVFGFDMALGTSAIGNVASYNGWRMTLDYGNGTNTGSGIDVASASQVRDNISSYNNGHGIRTYANAYIVGNKVHNNGFNGIRISSTDTHVEGNLSSDNLAEGICATSSDGLFLSNRSRNNTDHPVTPETGVNFSLVYNTSYGPVVTLGDGDLSGTIGANHPAANLEY